VLVTARPGVPGLVSVIVPSRSERFLVPTVQDLLAKAEGDIEVIVVLDGYWPDPPLPEDPKNRIRVIHFGEAKGMRPAINAAATIARGEYLLKCDAHVLVEPGFDTVLREDYAEQNWVLIPRRDRLDPENWCRLDVGKPPIDAHYLSNPLERPNDPACGIHGTVWNARAQKRTHILVDEEMSTQGSFWFMSRRHWEWLGPMDVSKYGSFIQEAQEFGCKTWLGGGKVMRTIRTTYLHLHKGSKFGRMYSLRGCNHEQGAKFATWYWMTDQWPERVHDLCWLIRRFWPVPTWGSDPEAVFAQARSVLRNPYAAAA
jgi:glycosyltransferase involved in cell wall biosynthesis